MYLKRLEVRGFKSFASATRFDLEPGVTAIVGPNGSGKSNVVDALTWVMGEQGARALRGGKMEDVIFAGTSSRPALGRAQVSLTIDNSDEVLPIEYTEVTISRTLFRSGASEYAINGTACRLLDIQELLSDTGMGRQMHVIVGQGQLDRILQATPEDRRSFIEEAAGVLKFRRRKEKTERKLAALEANLLRLSDLTKEVSRQLTPLGRQAKTARRAQFVQAELRDAKARILADDILQLHGVLDQHSEEYTRAKQEHETAQQQEQLKKDLITQLDSKLRSLRPKLQTGQELRNRAATLNERFNSLIELSLERQRHARANRDQYIERAGGRGGQQRAIALRENQLESLRQELVQKHKDVEEIERRLQEAQELLANTEEAAEEESNRILTLIQEQNRLARLYDELLNKIALNNLEVQNASRHVEEREDQLAHLPAIEEETDDRSAELLELQSRTDAQAASYESKLLREDRLRQLAALVTRLQRQADSRLHQVRAELETLERELASLNKVPNNLGERLTDFVSVSPGWEKAAAALFNEPLPVQLVGTEPDFWKLRLSEDNPAPASIRWNPSRPGPTQEPAPPQWGLAANTVIQRDANAPQHLASIIDELLAKVVFVQEISEAKTRTLEQRLYTVVSASGEILRTNSYEYHPMVRRNPLEVRSEMEISNNARLNLQHRLDVLATRNDQVHAALDDVVKDKADVITELTQLRAEKKTLEQALSEQAQQRLAREQQRQRAETRLKQAHAHLEQVRKLGEQLGEELDSTPQPEATEPDRSTEAKLKAQTQQAREVETELKLRLRGAQAESKSAQQQVAAAESNIKQEQRRFHDAREKAIQAHAQIRNTSAVYTKANEYLSRLTAAQDQLAAEVAELDAQTQQLQVQLEQERQQLSDLQRTTAETAQALHKLELAQHDAQQRAETTVQRARDELGMTPEFLIENYGPEVPVPVTEPEEHDKWAALRVEVDAQGNPLPRTKPFDRAEQEARLARATKDLSALGKFNPLALEEFSALQERHDYLNGQLDDLHQSKQDLLGIIRDVDEHVERVFAEAYADTAVEFESIFNRLFPGGTGRLILTDPEDMRMTGIDVEAKPAGKKVKRLSLLSGGERSLTALAMLIAIFKARPSPFYVLDEVEAALDDTNLGRLLEIFKDLQESSQLVIITHQKRTMEIADALYGVSMRGDGVSKVVTQKISTDSGS
ncbi:chromosome segregation protein SMC [Micrococcoides hystricis]|uniref:Chromosome partition protein Smc n=1 Tax=Micrococcoides hystricis TaxID=1572761 RepID=A0ABV6PE72_9MICC